MQREAWEKREAGVSRGQIYHTNAIDDAPWFDCKNAAIGSDWEHDALVGEDAAKMRRNTGSLLPKKLIRYLLDNGQ